MIYLTLNEIFPGGKKFNKEIIKLRLERDKIRYQQEWIEAMESALTCCGCQATTNVMFGSSSSFPLSYYSLPAQNQYHHLKFQTFISQK